MYELVVQTVNSVSAKKLETPIPWFTKDKDIVSMEDKNEINKF